MKQQQAIYLDYAAATPVDKTVLAAMQPYWQEQFYNPSALYLASKQVKHDLDAARKSVAHTLGVRPSEVIFTAGGTEANNMAIHGVMQQFPDAVMVVSAVEHDSVLKTAQQYEHHILPVDKYGRVVVDALADAITNDTVLVSVMHANNELGTIQPIAEISQQLQTIAKARQTNGNNLPLYLHVDASQSANYLKLNPRKLGIDLLTINGGKIYGPKQTGVLMVQSNVSLQPIIFGGGQERGLRSGTENVAGSIGFAKALELTQLKLAGEVERLTTLNQYFCRKLVETAPDTIINGKKGLPNFIHVTFPGVDNERLVMELDERGIQCAVGSACSASSEEPSHVLKAIGMDEASMQSSVRFTMGRQTTTKDIDQVIAALKSLIQ
jgi:cysteine desulfurase